MFLSLFLIFNLIVAPVFAGGPKNPLLENAGSLGKSVAVATAGVSVPVPAEETPASFRGAMRAPRVVFSENEYVSGHILKSINNCTDYLDVAVYAFSLQDVAEAIVKAAQRGVRVRVLINQSHVFSKRSPEIQYLLDNKVNMRILRGTGQWGIMHNKIGIFDGKMVKFGSFNWTNAADQNNFENAIFNTEPYVIAGYQNYFNWMWSKTRSVGDGPLEGDVAWGSYGPPPSDPKPSLNFNGALFPRYTFSPVGGCESAVVGAINLSQKSVYICMYSLFSQNVADALLKAKKRGVDVRIVMDRLQAGSSPLTDFFIKNKFNFKWTNGYSGRGVMHHKFGIFDGKLVNTGSFNWSGSAENNNLENGYFTAYPQDVTAFTQEFNKVFARAFVATPKSLSTVRSEITALRSVSSSVQ